MKKFRNLGLCGTFCSMLAIIAMTAGCPFNNTSVCDGFDADDDNPCTTDSCEVNDDGEAVAVNEAIDDCCQVATDCNDDDACTIDACSDIEDGTGTCTNTAVGQNCCNDDTDCDEGESCVANVCVADTQ